MTDAAVLKVCAICHRALYSVRLRRTGKLVCASCWTEKQNYDAHWFVKSLDYHAPTLPPLPKRKPFPGQLELFAEDEEEQANEN